MHADFAVSAFIFFFAAGVGGCGGKVDVSASLSGGTAAGATVAPGAASGSIAGAASGAIATAGAVATMGEIATTGASATTGANATSGASAGRGDSCAASNWTEWPMPNSQADIRAGASNSQSYADNGDGTVTDQVTGLMWQKGIAPGTFAWVASPLVKPRPTAREYCVSLSLGGHIDWHLPTLIELFSIVDYGRFDPTIDPIFSPSPAGQFWSATSEATNGAPVYVEFLEGRAFDDITEDTNFVRCVRCTRASSPEPRYSIANGLVYDTRTRLTWQQTASADTYAWAEAKRYCSAGWRLPTIKELETIVDHSVFFGPKPAIDTTAFPSTPASSFWSASVWAGSQFTVWSASFRSGFSSNHVDPALRLYARCVR